VRQRQRQTDTHIQREREREITMVRSNRRLAADPLSTHIKYRFTETNRGYVLKRRIGRSVQLTS